MRDSSLLSPGLLAQGFSLRRTAAQAISSIEITARATPGGKTRAAGQLAAFFTDCASKISALADLILPGFASARVTNAGRDFVQVTFSEPMDQTVLPGIDAFTLGGTAKTKLVTKWETPTILSIRVSVVYAPGNPITVAYTPPAVNAARDLAGNLMAAFTAQTVTNEAV